MWAKYSREFLRGLVRQRYAALHHALLAATIAAAMLAVGETPYFRGADIFTRWMFSVAHVLFGSEKAGVKEGPNERPQVVVIPNIEDQAVQHQCKSEEFVAEFIRGLADKRPALLAFTMELWPETPDLNESLVFPGGTDGEAICVNGRNSIPQVFDRSITAPIDDALRYAAQTRHVRIVLASPNLPNSAAAFRKWRDDNARLAKRTFGADVLAQSLKLDWVRRMCQLPNVSMGLGSDPYASLAFYKTTQSNIGNVAAKSGPDVCTLFRHSPSDWKAMLADGKFFDRLGELEQTQSFDGSVSLNPHYYDTRPKSLALQWMEGRPLAIPDQLTGRVVFVSDGFGAHQTLTLGRVDDGEANAAIYYSDLHPTKTLPKYLDFLVEVVLGIILGFLFSWSWHKSALAGENLHRSSTAGIRKKILAWAAARFLLVCNILLLVAVIYATFKVLNHVFENGTWINPLPLILGMSLKGLLNSRQRCTSHPPQSVRDLIGEHPDVLWQPLAVAALLFFAPLS